MNRNVWKLFSLMLVLLSLTACGEKQDETIVTTEMTEAYEETTVETTLPYGVADIDKLMEEGLLVTVEPENVEGDSDNTTVNTSSGENTSGNSSSNVPDSTTGESETAGESTKDVAETIVPTEAPASTSCGCEYEAYLAMSPADQEAYMNSFASPMDFITWSRAAEAEHAGHNTVTNVTGGDLDIGDFID